jgi:signal transduction histidine kinase
MNDNTDRKRAEEVLRQSEERFRRLVELMPVAVYVCDTSGIIQSYNKRAVELWGREPKSGDTVQRYCGSLRLYSPNGKLVPLEESQMAEVLRTGIEARDLEVMIERPNGSCITVLVNIVPLKNSDGELIGAMNCFQDITERKHAEKELENSLAQLRALAARLQTVREEESKRIAREIHDELGSALTSLGWDIEGIQAVLSKSESGPQLQLLSDRLQFMRKIVESTLNAVKRIASELRPSVLDVMGLAAAIDWQAQQFQARTGIVCQCQYSLEEVHLHRDRSTAVFRIFQEALTNVLRHAQATRIDINMKEEAGEFILSISDNGRGIREDEKSNRMSLGLLGMHERGHLIGGQVDVIGMESKGTVVTVRVPLADPQELPL